MLFDDIGVDAAKTGMLFSRRLIETVGDVSLRPPRAARRRSGHGRLLGRQAPPGGRRRDARPPPVPARQVVTPNLHEAASLAGVPYRRTPSGRLAEAMRDLGRAGGRRHGWSRDRGGGLALRRRSRTSRSRSNATAGGHARRGVHALGESPALLGRGKSLEERRARSRAVAWRGREGRPCGPRGGAGPVDVFGLKLRAGEDGLLRELERRGLAAGPGRGRHGGSTVGLVVTQDALVERIHFQARVDDAVARPRLQGRSCQPERSGGGRGRAEGARSSSLAGAGRAARLEEMSSTSTRA